MTTLSRGLIILNSIGVILLGFVFFNLGEPGGAYAAIFITLGLLSIAARGK